MDSTFMVGGVFAYIIFFMFLLYLAVLWLVLPFAIFGIKPRLDRMAQLSEKLATGLSGLTVEAQKTNQILAALLKAQSAEHPAIGLSTLTVEVQKTNQILAAVHNVKFE